VEASRVKAARITAKGQAEVYDAPEPEPGPGEALVRIRQCGICGSDLHVYRSAWKPGGKLGHEICGLVEALGEGVEGPAPGTRVCAECFRHCGDCAPCRSGDYNLCESISYLDEARHSGMAEKAVLPAGSLYAAPESFTDAQVMAVEPVAVSFRAVSRTGVGPGEGLGIIGAGTIGLLCVAAGRAAGAAPVVVLAKHPHQAALAEELGADRAVMVGEEKPAEAMRDLETGGKLHAVVETVALGTSLSTALAVVRKQGRVVVVAGITRPVLAALGPLVGGEVRITGSSCYATTDGRPDFAHAMDLIQSGAVPVDRLVTHTFPLERIEEAFGVAADKSSGSVKVAVRMTG
jgi:threonine dehydrogenase-like Zn-dependent dehydrogenase